MQFSLVDLPYAMVIAEPICIQRTSYRHVHVKELLHLGKSSEQSRPVEMDINRLPPPPT